MDAKRERKAARDAKHVGPSDMPIRTMVAVDESAAARSAVRLAGALAQGRRIAPVLVAVNEVLPLFVGATASSATAVTNALLGHEGEEERYRALRKLASQAVPEALDWPVRLLNGDAAQEIDATAIDEDAGLVIMGLRPHHRADRALGRETTLDVVRQDHVPVLAVVAGCEHWPTCIVVGTDFGQAAERAARLAARLLAPGGRLILVYAEAMLNYAAEDREGYSLIHNEGVRIGFERLRSVVDLPAGATVVTHDIDAPPVQALLDIAQHEGADLIAVGRQHHSAGARALLGSITTDLLRKAQCSVLVTPVAPWAPRRSQ
jgi:nucleotide-binding universal stress UspA family protein